MVLVLFMATIWLLTVLTTSSLRDDLEGLLAAQQFSTASYVADELEQSVRLRLDALAIIASEIDTPLLSDPARLQDLLRHRPLLMSLFSSGVWAIAASGSGVTAYPAETFNPSLSFNDLEYFQAVVATGKPVVGKPRIGRVSGKPRIAFAAPILARDGAIVGVLAGYSLLSDPTLFGSLEKANAGKTGWIAVSAPAHQLIVSSTDPKRILRPTAAPGVNKMFDKFVAGYEGSGVAVNSQGIETLTSAKQIPAAGWLAQVVLPTDEAFAPIRNLVQRVYGIAAGLSLLVAVLVWSMIRKMLQPLAETTRQIEDMASGRVPLAPLAIGRNDEIGILQVEFNRLAVARSEAEARIEDQKRRIDELSHHLLTAQEEERRRLALDLHDVVSPNIAAIRILLKVLADHLTKAEFNEPLLHLEDIQGVLFDTEAEFRKICAELRPIQLDYNGLTAAIEGYAQQFSFRTGIAVKISGHESGGRFPLEIETKLFRIVQEALTNSAKHAKPKTVDIQWWQSPDSGVLVIADDGIGFEMDEFGNTNNSPGLGLLTMRERAEFLGGSFAMESEPGRGTRITVEIARQGSYPTDSSRPQMVNGPAPPGGIARS